MNMNHFIHLGGVLFQWVLQTTWQAVVVAGLILAAQWLLRKRLSPSWRYGLWLLLVARLLMPVPPQSAFSIFNLARTAQKQPVAASSSPILSGAVLREPAGNISWDIPPGAESRGAPLIVKAPAVAKPAAKMDWFAVAFCGWLAGVCFFGARLVWTNGRFRSRIGGYQPVADESVTRLFNDCRTAFKIRQPVRLIESEEVESPAVYGLWRKWLLLPDGIFERFSTEELRCIFLHELAHIKRGDLGVNWLVAVLRVLHWFNPVLWLAWARMRADREMATDALALAHFHESDHMAYGETILKVLEGLTGEKALPGLVGIIENKAQIKERLAAIARPGKYWKWAALTLLAALAIIGLTDARTEKPKPQHAAAGNILRANQILPSLRAVEFSGSPLKAVVLLPDGTPVAGADVACVTPDSTFNLRGRSFQRGRSAWAAGQDQIIQTADDGSFTLDTEVAATAVLAAHEKGFVKVSLDSVRASGKIVLQPWGRIEGVLHIGSRLGTNELVGLGNIAFGARFAALPEVRANFQAHTDSQGRFVIPDVPPGKLTIGRIASMGPNSWNYTSETNIVVKAGEPTQVEIGGTGRPVIGRAALNEAGSGVDWTTAVCTLALKVPVPKFKTIQEQRAWRWDSEDAPQRFFYHALAKADGSFLIEDVPPGDYYLYIEIDQHNAGAHPVMINAHGQKEVTVRPSQGTGETNPFDLGTISVKVHHPLRVADMAAPLVAQTLDGQPLRLADYRGTNVLLFFGAPMEDDAALGQLKEIVGAFAGDKRLAIINILLDPDPDLVKDAIKSMGLACVHGVLSGDYTASGLDNYWERNVVQEPLVFLIGADGKIIGKHLRGTEINDTVAKTLAKR
jgi:beta-lactamase regulating signal transducer with metallopeptidase domain